MPKSTVNHRTAALAYVLLTLATLFWAGNAIIGRALYAEIPPVTFAFWRWALASMVLLPFSWHHLRRDWPQTVHAWPTMLMLSVLGVSTFNALLYEAAHTTTATSIALIQTAMPATIVVLSLLLFGERVSLRAGVGVALSITGALVVVAHGSLAVLAHLHFLPGDLLMLLAVLFYALYSVLLRKRPAIHALSFLNVTFVVGALALLPLYLWEYSVRGAPSMRAEVMAAFAYVAIFPSILAYLFWNHGVAAIGANRTGLFMCLVPVFASALAILLLGETLHVFHIVGLGLIVGGFLLFNRGPERANA